MQTIQIIGFETPILESSFKMPPSKGTLLFEFFGFSAKLQSDITASQLSYIK